MAACLRVSFKNSSRMLMSPYCPITSSVQFPSVPLGRGLGVRIHSIPSLHCTVDLFSLFLVVHSHPKYLGNEINLEHCLNHHFSWTLPQS